VTLDHLLDSLEAAPCIGVDLNVFYPEPHRGRDVFAQARSICAGCPVVDACFAYMLRVEPSTSKPLTGYAAGLTPEERAALYRQAAA
jgi:hypothetical protein